MQNANPHLRMRGQKSAINLSASAISRWTLIRQRKNKCGTARLHLEIHGQERRRSRSGILPDGPAGVSPAELLHARQDACCPTGCQPIVFGKRSALPMKLGCGGSCRAEKITEGAVVRRWIRRYG